MLLQIPNGGTGAPTAAGARINLGLGPNSSPTFTGLTVTGTATSAYLRLTSTSDASVASTLHAFQIGLTDGANVIFDNNEIMARNNGAAANLFLNNDGGLVTIGSGGITTTGSLAAGPTSITGTLTISSNISLPQASASILNTIGADGADTGQLNICGGGSASTTRGGIMLLYGNESASRPGFARLVPGDAVNAVIALDGPTVITRAGTPPLLLDRTDSSINSTIQYKNTSGSIYAGHGAANTFAIGSSANLNDEANQWAVFSSSNLTLPLGAPVIVLKDINGAGSAATGWMQFNDSANVRNGYVGFGSTGNNDLILNNDTADGSIRLQTNATGRIEITSAGVVELITGQLKFPATQNASSDANTLDDYEEGSWTPVVIGATTAGTGTYSNQVGTYTKVGNLVFITALVSISAHTGTGALRISGLPFSGAVTNHTLSMWSSAMSAATQVLTSGTQILFYAAQNSSTTMTLETDTSWSLRVSGCYVT